MAPHPTASHPLPRWKRTVDLAFCLLALPALAVCAAALAVVMAFTSPGPLFFTQERVGCRGRRFRIYKFRTMHVAASTASHQQYLSALIHSSAPMKKMDGQRDARVIPGGWLIRALGVDELPQVLNVWRGEMSVVGPRPCIPYEYEQYSEHHRQRCNAVPGLTGLWQVSGKNRTTFDEMVRLDIEYAETKSFWRDLRIIVSTPFALFVQFADTRQSRRAAAARANDAQVSASLHQPAAVSPSSGLVQHPVQHQT